MIEFDDVSFVYDVPGGAQPALRHVSFSLGPGELLCVLGANGSGKSTLARLCDALLLPSGGTVRVDGLDTRDPEVLWEIRSRVGLVFQNPDNQIVGTVVEEDVAFGPENLGLPRPEIRRRVDDALAAVGLSGSERREPHLLSEGQKQRVAIAGALAMDPEYLVFDEPGAMLDAAGRSGVERAVRRLRAAGRGIVHVTHRLEDVARADAVLVLLRGESAYNGPAEGLLEDPSLLERAGLALPPAGVMAAELRRLGVSVPVTALDAESVVASLWP